MKITYYSLTIPEDKLMVVLFRTFGMYYILMIPDDLGVSINGSIAKWLVYN